EERQDIEDAGLSANEASAGACCRPDLGGDDARLPGTPVDPRLAVGAERPAMAEELRPRARRDDAAARIPDEHDAVALGPVGAERRPVEGLARHGLHRV